MWCELRDTECSGVFGDSGTVLCFGSASRIGECTVVVDEYQQSGTYESS